MVQSGLHNYYVGRNALDGNEAFASIVMDLDDNQNMETITFIIQHA